MLTRVLVADNTRLHTELLAQALEREPGLEITLAGPDPQDVLDTATSGEFDVAVISSGLMKDGSTAELLRSIRAGNSAVRLVCMLDSSEPELVKEMFRAGARGILSRHESLDVLCKCVHCVRAGQVWASSPQINSALDALADSASLRTATPNGIELSRREREVVNALAEGLTNKEIAERLSLSPHTVKNYLFRVYDKLGVSNRIELLSMTMNTNGAYAGDPANPCPVPCPRHPVQAWVRDAAERGLVAAQLALAQMYWRGKGRPKDPLSAYKWYLIVEDSCADFREELLGARKELASNLTDKEIEEAEGAAAEWLEEFGDYRVRLPLPDPFRPGLSLGPQATQPAGPAAAPQNAPSKRNASVESELPIDAHKARTSG